MELEGLQAAGPDLTGSCTVVFEAIESDGNRVDSGLAQEGVANWVAPLKSGLTLHCTRHDPMHNLDFWQCAAFLYGNYYRVSWHIHTETFYCYFFGGWRRLVVVLFRLQKP